MKAFRKVVGWLVTAVVIVFAALLSLAQLAIGAPREVLKHFLSPLSGPAQYAVAWSFQITEAFVNQYEANFYVLAQQMAARFEPFVDVVTGIVGQSKSAERVGKTDAYDIQSRHADTKYVETPHSRRWIDLQDKGWADLVDELDEIRMLANPTSVYPKMAMAALNRAKDDVIYAAGRGSARTNTGTTALPAGQKIAEGGTGLTLAKLLSTKELLDSNEVEDDAEYDRMGQYAAQGGDAANARGPEPRRVLAVSAKQLTNLYGTTEIKSVDYNTVKALAQGAVDTFLGFRFVRSERLAKTGTTRFALAWSKKVIRLGVGKDIVTSIDKLPAKNMSVQVYARMSVGAVRVEDEGVVEIGCFE
jgi:hypothetical protein